MQHSSHCRHSCSACSTQLDAVDYLPRVRRWCTVEFICSQCNFQKLNTLEAQAVCVNITNPGRISFNRCHVNGLRRSIFHSVKNTDVRRYSTKRKTNTDKSIESELGGSVASYIVLVSHVLCSLLHEKVDIKLGRQVKHPHQATVS